MSLLSQFFPSGGGSQSAGSFLSSIDASKSSFPIDLLMIGGGGGGGTVPSTKSACATCYGLLDPNAATGGGGGSGRYISMLCANINTGEVYSIVVGAGGAAGQDGGTTCFGSTLIAGGGGGGGHPSRFGKANYLTNCIVENAGAGGADNGFINDSFKVIRPCSPAYPFFANLDDGTEVSRCYCVLGGRKSSKSFFGEDSYYDTQYCERSSWGYALIGACSPQSSSPCCSLSTASGGDAVDCCQFRDSLTCSLSEFNCPSINIPSAPANFAYNGIFYRANHPNKRSYIFGQSSAAGNSIHNSYPFSNPIYGRGCSFTNGSMEDFYARRVYNKCSPVLNCHSTTCPVTPVCNYRSIENCTAPGFINSSPPSPAALDSNVTCAAKAAHARWEFSPISDDSFRTAMMLSNSNRLLDDGPSVFTFEEGNCWSSVACGGCSGLLPQSFEISQYSCGCLSPNFSSLCGYMNITPFSHAATPCRVPTSTPNTQVKTYNPLMLNLISGSCAAPLIPKVVPYLCAPKTPCLHTSTWAAADNGIAATGSGGGGGINMNGFPAVNVFSWNYSSALVPVPGPAFYPNNPLYYTGAGIAAANPAIDYCRCITPSPADVATGGSGGSGVVWISYPKNYAAATVTGNTPVPSPPSHYVYYWEGNGTILFNQ